MKFFAHILSLLLFAGCSTRTPNSKSSEKVGLEAPKAVNNTASAHPRTMIFARFRNDHLSTNEINSILKKVFRCGAQQNSADMADICSLESPQIPTAAGEKNYPARWALKKTPKTFVWSQQLERDAQFTVELQDATGLPVPADVTVQSYPGHTIAMIAPSSDLAINQKLYLVGKIQGKNNSSQTMLRELVIKN